MNVLSLILVLAIIGLVLYLLNHYVPMDPPIKTIINVVVIIILIVWLIEVLFPGLGTITLMPPVRRGP